MWWYICYTKVNTSLLNIKQERRYSCKPQCKRFSDNINAKDCTSKETLISIIISTNLGPKNSKDCIYLILQ